jgi:hypothetical protein
MKPKVVIGAVAILCLAGLVWLLATGDLLSLLRRLHGQ